MSKIGDFFVDIRAKFFGFDAGAGVADKSLDKLAASSDKAQKGVDAVGGSANKAATDLDNAANSADRLSQSFDKIGAQSVYTLEQPEGVVSDLNDQLKNTERDAFVAGEEMRRAAGKAGRSFKGFGRGLDTVLTGALAGLGKVAGALSILAIPAALFDGFRRLGEAILDTAMKVNNLRNAQNAAADEFAQGLGAIASRYEDVSQRTADIMAIQDRLSDAILEAEANTQKQLKANEGLVASGLRLIGIGQTRRSILDDQVRTVQFLNEQAEEALRILDEDKRKRQEANREAERSLELARQNADFEAQEAAARSKNDQAAADALRIRNQLVLDELEGVEKINAANKLAVDEIRSQFGKALTLDDILEFGPEGIVEKLKALELKRIRDVAVEEKKAIEAATAARVEGIQKVIDKEKELQDLQNRQVGQFGAIQVGAGGAVFSDQSLLNNLTFNGMGGAP